MPVENVMPHVVRRFVVHYIEALDAPNEIIADAFGVSAGHVYRVRSGRAPVGWTLVRCLCASDYAGDLDALFAAAVAWGRTPAGASFRIPSPPLAVPRRARAS